MMISFRLATLGCATALTVIGLLTNTTQTHAGPTKAGRTLIVDPYLPAADFVGIQEAVDAAEPGDTIEVRAGRYFESIRFPRGGEPDRPITLRAAPGQIVLLTPAPPLTGEPEAVPGMQHVYRWSDVELPEVELDQLGLWEAASHLRLVRAESLDACHRRLGSWFYDADAGDLYIRSTGMGPASELSYNLEFAEQPGIRIDQPHIVIDGLWIAFGSHGILITKDGNNAEVHGCRLFCNRIAGIHATGVDHLLHHNELFRNNQYGIQLRRGVHHIQVSHNLSYYNGPNNGKSTDTSLPGDISMYSQGSHVLFEHNVIDGLHQNAYRYKSGHGGNNTVIFRHNVVRGAFDSSAPFIEYNTILASSLGPRFGGFMNRVYPGDNGELSLVDPQGNIARTNIVHPAIHGQSPRFADPAYRDFRLQSDSAYLGRGAHPNYGRVLYVDSTNGSDEATGLSTDTPLRTFERLAEVLRPADTIYLMPGRYEQPLHFKIGGLDKHRPLRIRAYGKSQDVMLTAGIHLESVRHVELDGLVIQSQPVRVGNSQHIRVQHTVFADLEQAIEVDQSQRVSFDHVTVADAALGLKVSVSRGLTLTHTLFHNVQTTLHSDAASLETFYADYNAYSVLNCEVEDQRLADLEAWQQRIKGVRASIIMSVSLSDDYALPARSPLAFAGADYRHLGARPEAVEDQLEVRNLRVAALSPATASLLWQTPRGLTEAEVIYTDLGSGVKHRIRPPMTFQIMGEKFDMTFRTASFFTVNRHAALPDLQPGRSYEATVIVRNVEGTAERRERIRFATPITQPKVQTFYVGPDGDDGADGTTTDTAWATFAHAVTKVGPGDTVLVLPGVYRQTLTPRTAGTAEHPIVFRSADPHAAVIDLAGHLEAGVEIVNVHHVHVDGFSIRGGVFRGGHNFVIANGHGIHVTGCRVELPPAATWDRLRLGHGGLVATHAPDLVVRDNSFACGYVGVGVAASDNARIEHNTIIGEGNYGIVIVPGSTEERYYTNSNLFYRAIMGYKTGAQIWMMNHSAQLESDRNLYFVPEGYKATIGKLPHTDRITSLEQWQQKTGLDQNSHTFEPVFVDRDANDFRLAPDSPGRDVEPTTEPPGVRW